MENNNKFIDNLRESQRRKDIVEGGKKLKEKEYDYARKYFSDLRDIFSAPGNWASGTAGQMNGENGFEDGMRALAAVVGTPIAAVGSGVTALGRTVGAGLEGLARLGERAGYNISSAISDFMGLKPQESLDHDFFKQDSVNFADVNSIDDIDDVVNLQIIDQNTGRPRDIQVGYKGGKLASIVDGDMDIYGRQNLVDYFKSRYNTDQNLQVGTYANGYNPNMSYSDGSNRPRPISWSTNSENIFVPSEAFDRARITPRMIKK